MPAYEVTLQVTFPVRAENNAEAIAKAYEELKQLGIAGVIFTTTIKEIP